MAAYMRRVWVTGMLSSINMAGILLVTAQREAERHW